MLSIVATETSALTVISIPGLAARGDLTFLQIAFGYLVGRIGVAALLLPGYFEGTQETAYQRLERSEEHTSELQSPCNLVCRLLLEKKKKKKITKWYYVVEMYTTKAKEYIGYRQS